MTAAAAASRRSFRFFQSRSRTANRLSASRLVRRSSRRTTGTVTRGANASMKSTACAVSSVGEPSRRAGTPTTISATPSSSPARRATSANTRSSTDCSDSCASTVRVLRGRARVRDGSLMANPIRRRPRSIASTLIAVNRPSTLLGPTPGEAERVVTSADVILSRRKHDL